MGRIRNSWESLQETLQQNVEVISRRSRLDIVSSDIDEIDPPENLEEYAEQAKTTGPVRKNIRQFTNDVWEPGYRLTADDPATVAYFMGEEEVEEDFTLPDGVEIPEGGFLDNAAVYGGEKRQDYYYLGKESTWQRWVRGTNIVELLKADPEQADSPITGFYAVRPETVYPQVHDNTNILVAPDQTDLDGVKVTRRGEAAAYIQFDDNAIAGPFQDRDEILLSQNDVLKQTLEADIGDDAGETQGVFGTSVIEGISQDISEYKQIKRDRAKAIETKAYGIWKASFGRDVLDLGENEKQLIEWDEDDEDDFTDEVGEAGPGDIITHDGTIEFDKFESEVPELEGTLQQLIESMMAPLPAPKFMVGFSDDINRDVTKEQRPAYEDLVSEERQYQEKTWTPVLKTVAERVGLDTAGLQLHIQPEQSDNPLESWDQERIDNFATYTDALATAAGPKAGPGTLVNIDEYLKEIAGLPEEVVQGADTELPEMEETPEDQEAMLDYLGVDDDAEALQGRYEAGEWVATPDGDGMIDDRVTEGTVDGMDASDDSPVYAVAMLDEADVNFYRASDLEATDGPTVEGVDDPTEDVEAMADIVGATTDAEALQFGDFDYPDSWKESPTPNRVILMDAWSSMGGQFDCGGACCMGELKSERLCASMKDAALGTHDWRGGWAD